MKHLPLFFCIVVLAAVCLPRQSLADLVINIAETPTGVAVEGSGTLDLEGLSVVFQGAQTVGINPTLSLIVVGGITTFNDVIDSYGLSNGTLPPNIGPGDCFRYSEFSIRRQFWVWEFRGNRRDIRPNWIRFRGSACRYELLRIPVICKYWTDSRQLRFHDSKWRLGYREH